MFLLLIFGLVVLSAAHSHAIEAMDTSTMQTDGGESEYLNIKNQIIKQFFADHDAAQLNQILDMIGCKTIDCPTLYQISSIEYMIEASTFGHHAKRYIGTGDRQNRQIIHTFNTTIVNNSTSRQEVFTDPQYLNVTQIFDVTIGKTADMWCDPLKEIPFSANLSHVFNFTKISLEANSAQNQTFVVRAEPQKITLEPFTKMDVTYNFYQYEQTVDYFLDFELASTSTIKHPGYQNSVVVFMKTMLLTYLQKNIPFVQNLKYDSPTAIRLEATEGGTFWLMNFPTKEKITNFGVDLKYGSSTLIHTQRPEGLPENVTSQTI